MSDDRHFVGPLISALKSPNPWDALQHLPNIETEASRWSTANLDQCIVGLICSRALIEKLADDEVPDDLSGDARNFFVQCGYSSEITVPRLVAARRLTQALIQLSLLFPRHFTSMGESHPDVATVPALDGFAAARGELTHWIDDSTWDFLMSSDIHWRQKLSFLQSVTVSLLTSLSWYFIRISVDRWPASLEGVSALVVFKEICRSAANLTGKDNAGFLALTDRETWTKLQQITEIVLKTYPAAIRTRLIQGNGPSGSNFVAVIDPTTALSVAALSLVSPWLEVISTQSDDSDLKEALQKYDRTRGRSDDSIWTRRTPNSVQHYTDFVSPVEGDGSFPASVPDVEYIVREIIVANGIEQILKVPNEFTAQTPRGWIHIRTPWAFHLDLIDTPGAMDMHRRSPLLAWIIHSSTNQAPSLNVFSNIDAIVDYLQETIAAADKRERFKQAMLDVESIAIPPTVALSTAAIIPYLFPDTPKALVVTLATMVYPGIKIFRTRIK